MQDDVKPHRPPQPRRIVPLAMIGARTNLGGTVASASSDMARGSVHLARVGDLVTHPELGEARIVTGLDTLRSRGQPIACAGSLTSRSGEFILDPGQSGLVGIEYDDGNVFVCLLDGWTGAGTWPA